MRVNITCDVQNIGLFNLELCIFD